MFRPMSGVLNPFPFIHEAPGGLHVSPQRFVNLSRPMRSVVCNPLPSLQESPVCLRQFLPLFNLFLLIRSAVNLFPSFPSFQESPGGLYICLQRFLGFGRGRVESYHRRTGAAVFVHIARTAKEATSDDKDASKEASEDHDDVKVPEKKVSRMAIGVAGGFDAGGPAAKTEYVDVVSVVTLPGFASVPIGKDIPVHMANIQRGIVDLARC